MSTRAAKSKNLQKQICNKEHNVVENVVISDNMKRGKKITKIVDQENSALYNMDSNEKNKEKMPENKNDRKLKEPFSKLSDPETEILKLKNVSGTNVKRQKKSEPKADNTKCPTEDEKSKPKAIRRTRKPQIQPENFVNECVSPLQETTSLTNSKDSESTENEIQSKEIEFTSNIVFSNSKSTEEHDRNIDSVKFDSDVASKLEKDNIVKTFKKETIKSKPVRGRKRTIKSQKNYDIPDDQEEKKIMNTLEVKIETYSVIDMKKNDTGGKKTTSKKDVVPLSKSIEDKHDHELVVLNQEPQQKQSTRGKRGAAKIAKETVDASSSQNSIEPPKKKGKSEANKPLKNKSVTSYESIDFSNTSTNTQGQPWNLKISSWNVDGIRAWLTKGGLEYIQHEKPDILCLQEVKCAQDKLPEEAVSIPGYHPYWLCSDKDGYAGVGIYTTKMAINVQYGLMDEELDSEGRIITAEYEQFYLICTYVPNAGRKLITLPKRLKWNEVFHRYVKELDGKKPVIICGDMNVAHNEIDLTNPKTNKKNAGFTPEERAGMTALLNDGFVDTFRHLYHDKEDAYTFWTYMMNCRAKNIGWRLDYMIISERLLPSLCDSVIRSEVYGSDHCPITMFLHLSSVPKIPSE